MRGKFLVIEGLDGSGKSTQVKLLFHHLKKQGFKIVLTHEPTYERLGKMLREYYLKKVDLPRVDALLFAADRGENVETNILPSLNQGKIIISDRYYHSSIAYQSAQGLELKWLLELNKYFPRPDLTVIVDTLPKTCVKRVEKAKPTKVKFENVNFLEKVRKNYLKFPKILDEKIIIIDGNRKIKEVHADVLKEVEKVVK
jgi:dTMP kinase